MFEKEYDFSKKTSLENNTNKFILDIIYQDNKTNKIKLKEIIDIEKKFKWLVDISLSLKPECKNVNIEDISKSVLWFYESRILCKRKKIINL